jgi:hypothetical protein
MPVGTRSNPDQRNPELPDSTGSDSGHQDMQAPAMGSQATDQAATARHDLARMESLLSSVQRELSEVRAQLTERPRASVT